MNIIKARLIFDSLLDEIGSFDIKEKIPAETVPELKKKLKKIVKAGIVLKDNDMMTLMDQAYINTALEFISSFDEFQRKLKKAAKDKRKADRRNKRFWFVVSDKKQIIGIDRNFIRINLIVHYHNFLVSMGFEKYNGQAAENKIYAIKGTKKTSDFLGMSENDFIDKTNKAFGGKL